MRSTYHPVSVLWHWLIAILIVAAYYFVLARPDTPGPSPEKLQMMSYHKWVGITVLAFSVLRIVSRFIFPAPAMGADVQMPAWQNKVHKTTLFLIPSRKFSMAESIHTGNSSILFSQLS